MSTGLKCFDDWHLDTHKKLSPRDYDNDTLRITSARFSHIIRPLSKLCKPTTRVKEDWGPEQYEAFEEIKRLIASAGALTPYDPMRETVLQVDS
eukprot:SAG11_NODE_14276_length_617_cov_2.562620_2_plen_93_part_01